MIIIMVSHLMYNFRLRDHKLIYSLIDWSTYQCQFTYNNTMFRELSTVMARGVATGVHELFWKRFFIFCLKYACQYYSTPAQ